MIVVFFLRLVLGLFDRLVNGLLNSIQVAVDLLTLRH